MGYERFSGGADPRREYDGRRDPGNYGRDDGYSTARDDQAAQRGDRQGYGQYGQRDYGNQRYAQRDTRGEGYGDRWRDDRGGGYGASEYHGSYASDGRRFEDVGRYAHADDDDRGRNQGRFGRQDARPQGYGDEDRGFFQRAGDELRSWFGDDEAERRREFDQRRDEQAGRGHPDGDYHSWRQGQIAAFDRDYHEYRQENRSRFENEFSSWRTERQGQRDLLAKVAEHLDVVGSDGEHVGTVDKVRGDRIILTKNDADAGGRHHSIPSRWLKSVDDKVTLAKTAEEAKRHWRDEERNQAFFGDGDDQQRDRNQPAGRTQATTY